MDTLAFGYILPTTGRITQTLLPRNVRRQAHHKKGSGEISETLEITE
jgi:hypothetical protein